MLKYSSSLVMETVYMYLRIM